jgi:hypothetical protein
MENRIPVKIPVIKEAAPNMPAVDACCDSTILRTRIAHYTEETFITSNENYILFFSKSLSFLTNFSNVPGTIHHR